MSAISKSTYSVFETRNHMLEEHYDEWFPITQIADQHKWSTEGQKHRYLFELAPGGGFGLIPAANTLNTQGTQANYNSILFDIFRPSATIELDGNTIAMVNKGAYRLLGTPIAKAELDLKRHTEILLCGNGDGILGKNASGTSGTATITGVTGIAGGTTSGTVAFVQRTWLWPGQRVQIGTGAGTSENVIISNIVHQADGTSTITTTTNLTYTYSGVDIYMFGGAGVAMTGLLKWIANTGTVGVGETINRANYPGLQCWQSDKDAVISSTFATHPLKVLAAAVASRRDTSGHNKAMDLFLMPDMVKAFIIDSLSGQRLFEPETVFGWPALKNLLPGVDAVCPPAWPNGYVVGLHKGFLDKPTLQDPQWEEGYLRGSGTDAFERYICMRAELIYANLALGVKLTGFVGLGTDWMIREY
jgi:hypothetical protein